MNLEFCRILFLIIVFYEGVKFSDESAIINYKSYISAIVSYSILFLLNTGTEFIIKCLGAYKRIQNNNNKNP